MEEYTVEEWRPVVGFEGFYEVSSLGRIRSCDREVNHYSGGTRTVSGKIKTLGRIWSGYLKVTLSKNGRSGPSSVHRIVCEAFHGAPPSSSHHAAHTNGVRDDNRAANLRWVTPKENEADKIRHGTLPTGSRNGKYTEPWATPRGERASKARLTANAVVAIRIVREKYGVPTRKLAAVAGVSKNAIEQIIKRQSWRHIT